MIVYFDDILIYSNNEDHLVHLKEVLLVLKENKLYINFKSENKLYINFKSVLFSLSLVSGVHYREG